MLLLSLIIFSVCYFSLKSLKASWEKNQLPKQARYLLGILSWGVLISSCGILWEIVQPIIDLFTAPNFEIAIQLMILSTVATVFVKISHAHPEFFDFPSMKLFIKDSIRFSNPARRKTILSEELDKHNIRRIYKETTGKELPEYDEKYERALQNKLQQAKKDEYFYKDKRVPASKQVLAELKKPIESIHLKEELKQLQEKTAVDISDSWYLNRQKKSAHQYYHIVRKVIIDPASQRIEFILESSQFTDEKVHEREALYRIKQNLYDFLQAVNQQEWTQPYLKFVSLFSCTCSYVEDGVFGGPQVHSVCRMEVSRAKLKEYENKFFDVGNIEVEILN